MSDPSATPWTAASQALLSRQEAGVGRHSLGQGIFPTQGSNLRLPHRQVDSLPLNHQGSPSHSQVPAVSKILGKTGLQWDLHNLISLFTYMQSRRSFARILKPLGSSFSWDELCSPPLHAEATVKHPHSGSTRA